jgi:hypothetical protein
MPPSLLPWVTFLCTPLSFPFVRARDFLRDGFSDYLQVRSNLVIVSLASSCLEFFVFCAPPSGRNRKLHFATFFPEGRAKMVGNRWKALPAGTWQRLSPRLQSKCSLRSAPNFLNQRQVRLSLPLQFPSFLELSGCHRETEYAIVDDKLSVLGLAPEVVAGLTDCSEGAELHLCLWVTWSYLIVLSHRGT